MKKINNFASGISSAVNSPIPTSLKGECKKAAKILNSFLDPGQGMDKIIPENILEKAQGLAIYTVLKAGFLFSGRAGSGIVIARLPEGGWSAPSAIGTGGIGAGGQIGAELTDFVLVLNTQEAVKTFCQLGNVTLGGNVSVAAGPIGRNAEASGSANLKHIAAIYSYSKTRGLFAGVSLEGSVVVSRGDANEKLYGQRVTAKQLLTGAIPPPPEADALYRALNAKFHTLGEQTYSARSMTSEDGSPRSIGRSSGTFKSAHISAPGTLRQPPPVRQSGGYGAPMAIQQQPYNPTPSSPPSYQPPAGNNYNNSYGQDIKPPVSNNYNNNYNSTPNNNYNTTNNFASQAAAKRAPPPPPPSRKPVMAPSEPTARALYAFDGQQQGDLSFQEGDVITIVQKTDSQDDWWTGKINGRQGIFPANYVQLQ
ncbi:hypothetical protein V8B55DRAFT_1474136 [Mucor lusitanicus]|uniref:SH3 domain-containing protein n=2 Tax=Mucor circinelloides f. lusitanicus TaxID=29924 RepID=A0A168PFN6_MUCCL|nr:hypothetical protein FB192DRAFT_1374752 [Mucor lusitanicus]OAD07668.1 hypothetical protein MUCCIDRAFT_186106 [Mucor lusitanicus CBS 277.49]